MELNVNGVRYHVETIGKGGAPVIVLLHGFTGSTHTWKRVKNEWTEFRLVAIDLIGHGKTDSPLESSRYRLERQLEDLDKIVATLNLQRFTLLGYSMGGRTALAYACEYPERIEQLVLESASPGLADEQARCERRKSDAALAQFINDNGVASFVGKWENIPLFESQRSMPDAWQQEVRNERLEQSSQGLANSLLGMGTGHQPSYWECLPQLKMPVLIVTGKLDKKFCAIAAEMKKLLPSAKHQVISAGHAIHVEKPAEFATIVKEQLKGIFEED